MRRRESSRGSEGLPLFAPVAGHALAIFWSDPPTSRFHRALPADQCPRCADRHAMGVRDQARRTAVKC